MVLAEEDSLKDSAVDSRKEVLLVVVDVVVVDSEEAAAKVVDVVDVVGVEDAGREREAMRERAKVGDHFRADLWRRPYSWPPYFNLYNNIKSVVPKLLACQLFNQPFCFCYFDKLSKLLTR